MMRTRGPSDASLVVRSKGEDHNLRFGVSGKNGWELCFVEATEGGQPRVLKRVKHPIVSDKWYTASVRVRGGHMTSTLRDGDRDVVLDVDDDLHPQGGVGLRTWRSAWRFRNIRVTSPDGKVLWEGPPRTGAAAAPAGGSPTRAGAVPRATIGPGTWKVEGDELVQSNGEVDAHMMFGDPDWSDYDLTLEAKKVEGAGHGLEVLFHRQGPKTFAWLGLGVFENKGCEMYFEKDGQGSRASDTIKDNWAGRGIDAWGAWHSIKIEVRKTHFKSYLDGKLLFQGSHHDHTHGRLGLRTGKIQARFRKIKVTAPRRLVLFEGVPDLYPMGRKVPRADAGGQEARRAALQRQGPDGSGKTLLPNGSEWKGRRRDAWRAAARASRAGIGVPGLEA